MVPFESLGMVSYSPPKVTKAVSLAISEIFSVKELDFDLTVSIVHPMGGGLQLVFFGYPSDRGIRKGQSCSSTLLRYYGTANYMLPLETHINQGYPL